MNESFTGIYHHHPLVRTFPFPVVSGSLCLYVCRYGPVLDRHYLYTCLTRPFHDSVRPYTGNLPMEGLEVKGRGIFPHPGRRNSTLFETLGGPCHETVTTSSFRVRSDHSGPRRILSNRTSGRPDVLPSRVPRGLLNPRPLLTDYCYCSSRPLRLRCTTSGRHERCLTSNLNRDIRLRHSSPHCAGLDLGGVTEFVP